MILLIQILIIFILVFTLISIYIDEFRHRWQRMPHAVVEEIWLGEERRKTARVKSKLDATYYYDKGNERAKRVYTENISTNGMKIIAEEKLKKEIPLSFEIKIPDIHKPIIVKGEVAWVDDVPQVLTSSRRVFGTGIRFTYLRPIEKKRLSQFIKKVLASQAS